MGCLIIISRTESRPVPKCSLKCFKTGINTSDDFCWCVSISDGGYGANEAPWVFVILIIILSKETRPLPTWGPWIIAIVIMMLSSKHRPLPK